MRRARASFLIGACVAASLVAGCGVRGEYPQQPIVLISPWAAGGGTDRVARHFAVLLERELGVPVNVVNATGGAGVTGHSRGALARPDGYTLTLMTVELNMLVHRGLTPISYRDFEPIAMINRDAAAVFVRADSEWTTLASVEERARRAPRSLRASGTARGGIWHVALAGWLKAAGLGGGDIAWVPINGAAPALGQLLAGGIDVVVCSLPEARTLLEGGKLRALGVMSDVRVPGFSVPTLAEAGRPFELWAWRGVGVPRGTPPAIRQRLVDATAKVITSTEYTDFMQAQGFSPAAMVGEGFSRALSDIDLRMKALVQDEAIAAAAATRFGPMLFPGLLAGVLALAWGGLLVVRVRPRQRGLASAPEAAGAVSEARESLVKNRAFDVLGAIVVYVVVSEYTGFLLAAALVVFALALRLGTRLRTAALVTGLVVPLCYQLFSAGLRVPLPRGWLGW